MHYPPQRSRIKAIHTFRLDLSNWGEPIVDWLNHVLPRIPLVILSILVGILAVRMLVRAVRWMLKLTSLPKGLRQITISTIETMLWIFLTIQVLGWAGFGNIIVFFSSSALAIGILLAAGGTTLLSDLVAGIFLARDNDFNVGDEVKAGENQMEGIIESMDVRRVRIRDKDGLLHVLPNSTVERKEWVVIKHANQNYASALVKATQVAKRIKAVAHEKKADAARKKAERS